MRWRDPAGTRRFGALMAALVIGGLAGSARPGPVVAASTVFRCTNPESGASWTLKIDFDHGKVDGYPATVGQRMILWHDTENQGYYRLDQVTGDLRIVHASSMGGWEQHAVCRQQ
ncbi:MAG TPA: hypothetical protein VG848_04270 [Acetobacteraceae bacterium]|jgi:hypothetical protein|nr:hypothetical protein [Acetobacteraceae bacterium]